MLAASVVVPAYNAVDVIEGQLEALAGQRTARSWEVVVVDNGSDDATAARARAWGPKLPGLRVISATSGRGVAVARNAGIEAARGEAVLFCDADDVCDPGWVEAMTGALERHDLVGGRLSVTRLNSAEVLGWGGAPDGEGLARSMRYLPYATGANLGVRRSVALSLGGFDETFVGGHEEVDFAWRAQRAGFTLGFAPDALIHYRLRGSLRGVYRQRFGYGRSHAQLYARYPDAPIRVTSWRHQVKVTAGFLGQGPRRLAPGADPERRGEWVAQLGWVAGRWWGNAVYKTLSPL